MHNLAIPGWARYRMTQDGNPDVFWWMNSKQIQPVVAGNPKELMEITEKEFKLYTEGEYEVKVSPIIRILENK